MNATGDPDLIFQAVTNGVDVGVRNTGSVKCWVGGPDVNATTLGFGLSPGEFISFDDLDHTEAIYGLTASGTTTVDVIATKAV